MAFEFPFSPKGAVIRVYENEAARLAGTPISESACRTRAAASAMLRRLAARRADAHVYEVEEIGPDGVSRGRSRASRDDLGRRADEIDRGGRDPRPGGDTP